MKKLICTALLAFLILTGAAFAASKEEMKRMSVFVSNFTETGFFNFDLEVNGPDNEDELEGEPKTHLGNPANVTELIRFGIMHNLMNNYKTRIKKCKNPNCEAGDLTLDKKFVEESVKKYFDIDLKKKDLSVITEDPTVAYSFDGKLYHFSADSFKEPGQKIYYADVQGVRKKGKYLAVAGDIYNSKKITDRPGMFEAIIKPYKWNGKDTWAIIDMTTDWVTNAGRD